MFKIFFFFTILSVCLITAIFNRKILNKGQVVKNFQLDNPKVHTTLIIRDRQVTKVRNVVVETLLPNYWRIDNLIFTS